MGAAPVLGQERNDRASHGRHLRVREQQWVWTHPLGIQEEPQKALPGVVVPASYVSTPLRTGTHHPETLCGS